MARSHSGPHHSKSTTALVREARALRACGLKLRAIADQLAQTHPELGGVAIATVSYWSRGLVTARKKFRVERAMGDAELRRLLVELAIGALPERGTGRRRALEGAVRRAVYP